MCWDLVEKDLSNGRLTFSHTNSVFFDLFNELPNWSVSGHICMGKRCSSPVRQTIGKRTLYLL